MWVRDGADRVAMDAQDSSRRRQLNDPPSYPRHEGRVCRRCTAILAASPPESNSAILYDAIDRFGALRRFADLVLVHFKGVIQTDARSLHWPARSVARLTRDP